MLLRWGKSVHVGSNYFNCFSLFLITVITFLNKHLLKARKMKLFSLPFPFKTFKHNKVQTLGGKKCINQMNPHSLKWAEASLKQGKGSSWRYQLSVCTNIMWSVLLDGTKSFRPLDTSELSPSS